MQGLHAGDDAKRAEAWDIGGIDRLDVLDPVAAVAGTVGGRRLLEGVEGRPNRTIADRVDLDLPAAAIRDAHRRLQLARLPVWEAKRSRLARGQALVGRQHRRRPGFDDAIGECLDDPGRDPGIATVGEGEQLVLLEPALPVGHGQPGLHAQAQAGAEHRAARRSERLVNRELFPAAARLLDAGEAMPKGERGRGCQALDVLGHRLSGERRVDQLHGGLFQDPGGMARRIALDLASWRIRGVVADAQPA